MEEMAVVTLKKKKGNKINGIITLFPKAVFRQLLPLKCQKVGCVQNTGSWKK